MSTITIKDIAKMCGVGVSTVSRAMNNHPDINPETKEMIMDIIRAHNYVPNNSARNLKRTDAKCIAVLIKGIGNPFFTKMIKVMEKEIHKKKYSFVLQQVDERQDEIEVAIELEKEKRLNGIVFLGGYFAHAEEKLKQITVPFVLSTIGLIEDSNQNRYPSVSVDDMVESEKAVVYLIEQGHRDIAIIGPSEDDASIGELRVEGYKKALKAHGIPFRKELVGKMKEELDSYTMENGYEVAKELLESGQEFTAVYAISDSMAIGACRAIFDAGKKVPGDYSVIGFDGLDIAHFYRPSITTIRQPVEEMAKATIQILFDCIKKKPYDRQRVFPGELLIGESTRNILGEK